MIERLRISTGRAVSAAFLAIAFAAPATAKSTGTIEPVTGVWVEGRGYDVTYGGTYDACAARCLATSKCVMIEFYRPEKKCNLYDQMRPRKSGGASKVGIRRLEQSALDR